MSFSLGDACSVNAKMTTERHSYELICIECTLTANHRISYTHFWVVHYSIVMLLLLTAQALAVA